MSEVQTYKAAWLGTKPGDAASIAVDDDGHLVASWISSSINWAFRDLPRGFKGPVELIWVTPDELPRPCPGCDECRAPREAAS